MAAKTNPVKSKKSKSQKYAQHRARMAGAQRSQSAAGREIGKLPPVRGKQRRSKCRLDLRKFCETYLKATFNLGWSEDHLEVIRTLEVVCLTGGKFCLAMPRGSGKSSLVNAACIWAILFGHRKFAVLVSATADESQKVIDSIRAVIDANPLIKADFPEVSFPIAQLGGINQRAPGQMHQGARTNITWTGKELVYPTIAESASSGSATYSVGITSAVRGLSLVAPDGSTRRPDIVLVNDPSTDESARSLAENNRRERTIMGALGKLAGPSETISMVVTCTIIAQGDLASRLLDPKKHPEFQGKRFSLLKSMPKQMELWARYKEIRAESLTEWGDIRDATAFYREHRKEMDDGCVAAWEQRREKHHLSAIQFGMDQWAEDEESFWSEFQNAPLNRSLAEVETLNAEEVAERYNGIPRDIVPDWAEKLTCAIDIQGDSLWWLIAAWDQSMRGHVVDYGVYPEQPGAYVVNNDIALRLMDQFTTDSQEAAWTMGLEHLAEQLLSFSYPKQSGETMQMSALAVDANWGRTTDIVYQLARQKFQGKILPAHGRYVGATGTTVDQWRGEKGDKRGPGWILQRGRRQQRHVVFDANQLKSWLVGQLAGNPGISIPGDSSTENQMLADNLSAEYGTEVTAKTGRRCTEWRLLPGRDNHLFDCLLMSAVLASIEGASLPGQVARAPKTYYSAAQRQREARERQQQNQRRR